MILLTINMIGEKMYTIKRNMTIFLLGLHTFVFVFFLEFHINVITNRSAASKLTYFDGNIF